MVQTIGYKARGPAMRSSTQRSLGCRHAQWCCSIHSLDQVRLYTGIRKEELDATSLVLVCCDVQWIQKEPANTKRTSLTASSSIGSPTPIPPRAKSRGVNLYWPARRLIYPRISCYSNCVRGESIPQKKQSERRFTYTDFG